MAGGKNMINITTDITKANFVTHGGAKFHADEVLSTVILSKVFEEMTLIRLTRKEILENINPGTLVYDIGEGKYDHHQKDGNGHRDNGVPYAACGLIWKDFGKQIIKNSSNPDMVWEIIDRDLIQGIDAIDNGVMPKVDYSCQSMTFSGMIRAFTPNWDENISPDVAFLNAVKFAEEFFTLYLQSTISSVNAETIVAKGIENSEDHIMVFEQYVSWQEHLFASNNPKADEIWFVIFPSDRGGYNWQCVPDALGSFGQRKSVPIEWRGLSNDLEKSPILISDATGVATATFCHPAGFIGGAETLEDAIALAKIAVNS